MATNLLNQLITKDTIAQLAKSTKADEGQVESLLTSALPVLFEKVIEKSGYMQMLIDGGQEEADRIDNLKELVSNAVQYEASNEQALLSGFLEEVALISDVDNYDPDSPAVVLMTIHSAKGLEFPVVFLPGMEETIFPGAQSTFEQADRKSVVVGKECRSRWSPYH